MKTYYTSEQITGVINSSVEGNGITSTDTEEKTIKAVSVVVSTYQGNIIEGFIEREKIISVYDYLFDTFESTGGTSTQKSTTKLQRLLVGHLILIGDTFKLIIVSGGTANNLFVQYEYEIK